MGQVLSDVNSEIIRWIDNDRAVFTLDSLLSGNGKENIDLFLPTKALIDTTPKRISFSERVLIKQIQHYLLLLTETHELTDMNNKISKTLIENGLTAITHCYRNALLEMKTIVDKQRQLRNLLIRTIHDRSILLIDTINSTQNNQNTTIANEIQDKGDIEDKNLFYTAINLLTTLLLVSIKAHEQTDPSIGSQIVATAASLCEQISIKSLSYYNQSSTNSTNAIFQSLKPLITYMHELSISSDRAVASQAITVLLKFSIAQKSFRDLLPVIKKLIFNSIDVYDVRHLFVQLNHSLTQTINQFEQEKATTKQPTDEQSLVISLAYLTSNKVFPNAELNNLNNNTFTGEFISSIILSHVDIYNEINSHKQLQNGTMYNSISFEFHPDTFKQLFEILEQISSNNTENSKPTLKHILTVCLKLFQTHLQFLRELKSNIENDLLTKINDELIKIVPESTDESIDSVNLLKAYTNENQLNRWFGLLLNLAREDDAKSESNPICREASKALIHVINLKAESFIEKLSFIHKCIIENKYPILVEQLLIELNKTITLMNWIEIVMDDKLPEKAKASNLLYSFVNACFSSTSNLNEEQRFQMQQIIVLFLQLFLARLIPKDTMKTIQNKTTVNNELDEFEHCNETISSSTFVEILSYILRNYMDKLEKSNDLMNQILVGLCLMTQRKIFRFTEVQPIFVSVLPFLSDYLLVKCKNTQQNKITYLYWLIGKMIQVLINGPQHISLETKHSEILKWSLFSGGCEQVAIQQNKYLRNLYESSLVACNQLACSNPEPKTTSDHEFLLSIYNNTDQGAKLISKIKSHVKTPPIVLKSIELKAQDVCASLFAVYVKHYRRINIAKAELTLADDSRPHSKLLSLYEYASQVKTWFVKKKAEGENCDELYKTIKMKALFLLSTVKESHFIPIIQDDLLQSPSTTKNMMDTRQQQGILHQRQDSKWTRAKHTLHACIRFKKLILAKRQAIEQNQDNESILNKQIFDFVCGNVRKKTTSQIHEEMNTVCDELTQCLVKQHERAITRLITYQFVCKFLQNTLKNEENKQTSLVLSSFLPFLRKSKINWYYLENIKAVNNELKEDIRDNFYNIITIIIPFILKSKLTEKKLFNLLNLSYEEHDICLIHRCQFIEVLYKTYVSFVAQENGTISLKTKLIGYNWFRSYVLKVCAHIQNEQWTGTTKTELVQEQNIIFNQLILNELKELRRLKQELKTDIQDDIVDSIECRNHSLNNSSIQYFIYGLIKGKASDFSQKLSSKFVIELVTNQWLTLLLRCVHLYEHVRSMCSTMAFIQELLYIYQNSENKATVLLALKILRDIFPLLPEPTDEASKSMMNTQLYEILYSIGDRYISEAMASETVTELICMYRTIMSYKSTWQMRAAQLVLDSIISVSNKIDSKSFENMDEKQSKYLLASLFILGGYLEPPGLGSVVKVYNDENTDENDLALIIDINQNPSNFAKPDLAPYFIQYLQKDKTEWTTIDKLEVQTEVTASDLLVLSNTRDSILAISKVLDILGSIIQMDVSSSDALHVIQLKRYSMLTLYNMLSKKEMVDIFIQKPYALFITQLSMIDSSNEKQYQPADLRLFNRSHLEQYCLSLDRWKSTNKLVENSHQNVTTVDVQNDSSANASNITNISRKWKSFATESEIKCYKKGYHGNDDLCIVPYPEDVADMDCIQECGNKHRFRGRIHMTSQNTHRSFPTFLIKDLQLSEGNWYYCVRLPVGGLVQIGWATDGFVPRCDEGNGIGDDEYSWSFDGSRGTLYNNQEFMYLPSNIRWTVNDVCGCGIEINGTNTRISYWLNGKFIGTAFTHQANIASTNVKCNLLPNGPNTTYYPGVTIQAHYGQIGGCEFIISPEDMIECPLPDGYKPILMPKLGHEINSLVAYPYSAYLVGDCVEDFVYTPRCTPTVKLLRDFINQQHIKTELTITDHQLRLSSDSDGFPFSIESPTLSLTICFDFQMCTTEKSNVSDNIDIVLFKLHTPTEYSLQTSVKNNDKVKRTVISINAKEQQIKIYMENSDGITTHQFNQLTNMNFEFHILPNIDVGISQFAVWKYALPEEHIRRIFNTGISYVSWDYKQFNEYRLQANTFTFSKNQQEFLNDYLLPMIESSDKSSSKQNQVKSNFDESNFFRPIPNTDKSAIQLYGNKSYLILKKSPHKWYNFTIILDISIPEYPTKKERLSLIQFNSETELFISSDGRLCLSTEEDSHRSELPLELAQFLRLIISADNKEVQIYSDGLLMLHAETDDGSLFINPNQIDLFRESKSKKNTTSNDTLRIECKSITFLNQSIKALNFNETLKLSDYSLEELVAPPYKLVATSLISIGYKQEWIKSVMKQHKTSNIQLMDTLMREHIEELSVAEIRKQQQHIFNILTTLGSSINHEKLEKLVYSSSKNIYDEIEVISDLVLTNWNDLQTPDSPSANKELKNENSSDPTEQKWFSNVTEKLALNCELSKWIQDPSNISDETIGSYELFDLSKSDEKQAILATGLLDNHIKVKSSMQYSHIDITYKEYLDARIACERGLVSIYACETVLNILNIGSNYRSKKFPFEKLGDYTSIIKLLRSMEYHYTYSNMHSNDIIDTLNCLVKTILKNEIQEFNESTDKLQLNTRLFVYHLHKNIFTESIKFLSTSSLLNDQFDYERMTNMEYSREQKANLHFILTMLKLLVQLVSDKSTMKQDQIDQLILAFFPEPMINMMFDLFLLLPKYQSKIYILDLFINLMQTSIKFNLNERITDFMSHLLIQLLSEEISTNNRRMKRLRNTIMDFVFLNLTRQKSQFSTTENFEDYIAMKLSDFPENFRDLWMIIDTINAITDEAKATPYPHSLFLQSFNILDDSLDFTLDDTTTANFYFNMTSDLQLISLMNNDALIEHSFSEFIQSLGIGYLSGAKSSELYPALFDIPPHFVQTRAKLFFVFEMCVEKVLSLLDFSLPPGKSVLVDKIRLVRSYLSNRKRMEWLENMLNETKATEYNVFPTVQFDFIKASDADNNEQHTAFNQGFEQLHEKAHLLFRNDNSRFWRAYYVGLHSTDQGGPYRDSITRMCSDICSTRLPLFILCPNGKNNVGSNRDRWIPNVFPPNESIPVKIKKQYRFVGQLMGMALRKKHYLSLKFPNLLWKQLVGEPVTMKDIESIDIQSFAIIKEMENKIQQSQSIDNSNRDTNYLFSSIMSEFRFDIISSSGQTYELIPGGKDISITADNFKEYCAQYREYRLNEFRQQIEFIRQGLLSVIPNDYLTLLTSTELEESVCGKDQIDIELLKRNSNCTASGPEVQYIQRFWKIFTEIFNDEQRKLLLQFVWGRNTLPSRDEDFPEKFTVSLLIYNESQADRMLPRSNTCSFALHLPTYSTIEVMYERLNYAITYCSGIDADG